jgi:hypothetical protein
MDIKNGKYIGFVHLYREEYIIIEDLLREVGHGGIMLLIVRKD